MRKTLGVALVAAAVVFAGCGGDSDTTPRAFETEGPAEASWNKVQPLVERVTDRLDQITDREAVLADSKDLVEALEHQAFEQPRYDRLRTAAQRVDSLLEDLLGDGSPAVRARDIAHDMVDYTTGVVDDGTVAKMVDRAGELAAEVNDLYGNNAVESLNRTMNKLVDQADLASQRVRKQSVMQRVNTLVDSVDTRFEEIWGSGGAVENLREWTADLIGVVQELIKP